MIKDILDKNSIVRSNERDLEILKENFPGCFNADGSFDIKKLVNKLNDKIDISKEGYELNFLGKGYSKLISALDTTTVVKPNTEHNRKEINNKSKNIYITGDNLDGLKHLVRNSSSKIKFIYIDPPYNTDNEKFTYEDSFNFTAEELSEKLSIDEDEAQRILDMTNRGDSSHSAWLTFMLPRLLLSRELLTKDGIIFISIDDNEQSNLKLLCDEIFGEENFIANFTWVKKKKGSHLSKTVRSMTEYVLGYAKDIRNIELFGDNAYSDKWQPLSKRTNAKKALKFKSGKLETKLKDGEYKKGIYGEGSSSLEFLNNFNVKEGMVLNDLEVEGPFVWTQKKLDDELELGTRVALSSKFGFNTFRADQLDKVKRPTTILDSKLNIGTNEDAYDELKHIFNKENVMSYPKPTSLIKYLINTLGHYDKNFTILDFFSGSGTTADAVMQLNAEDGGNRNYIMMQIPANIKENSKAKECGFNTIDQIGRYRIETAAKNIKDTTKANIDYGFKHYELCQPSNDTLDKIETFIPSLVEEDNTLLDEFDVETVVTTWAIQDGYGFDAYIKEIDLNGYTAYCCKKHIYMVNPNITESNIISLIEKFENEVEFNPENIVLFGYSFISWTQIEMLKSNIKQLDNGDKNLKVNIITRY